MAWCLERAEENSTGTTGQTCVWRSGDPAPGAGICNAMECSTCRPCGERFMFLEISFVSSHHQPGSWYSQSEPAPPPSWSFVNRDEVSLSAAVDHCLTARCRGHSELRQLTFRFGSSGHLTWGCTFPSTPCSQSNVSGDCTSPPPSDRTPNWVCMHELRPQRHTTRALPT